LKYLEDFETNDWKFNKNNQTYLLENFSLSQKIPKRHFLIFCIFYLKIVNYISDLKGKSREVLLILIKEIILGL
jgi:hypothetical protein